jgi:pimeloyl-ACP methyl ester carboxylesterase
MIDLAKGGAHDLYFIHGMWSTPEVWNGLRARFEGSGHATHAPALPYHDRRRGEAPHPALAALGLRDYIDFLVDDVSRLSVPPIIVGHSMGGFLAQAVAARVQPAGVVLLSPAATAATAAPAFAPLRTAWPILSSWGWWKRPTLIDASSARWGIFNEVPAAVADAEIDALVWDSGRVLAELSAPWAVRSGSAKVDYARLTCPALIVSGLEDRITPTGVARATARAWTGPVDYHELPGVGHWLFHSPVVERVATLIEGWLPRA